MRLLDARELKLVSFDIESEVPDYAILSHTWGRSDEEVSFHDLQELARQPAASLPEDALAKRLGWDKIAGACDQALRYDCQYVWIDTCCIDKASSTELQEAINSMFKWYEHAKVCFAQLSDVSTRQEYIITSEAEFRNSRWFTRGWTLQELLAPERIIFFDKAWQQLGYKSKLRALIGQITGINPRFIWEPPSQRLPGYTIRRLLSQASVSERMSWAARRCTTRKEDEAYCLLGIFDINMPMLYGEGSRAFARLQDEILRVNDDSSILAWGYNFPRMDSEPDSVSILAPGPSSFKYCGNVKQRKVKGFGPATITMTPRGLLTTILMKIDESHEYLGYAILGCGPRFLQGNGAAHRKPLNQLIAIPLISARACSGFDSDEEGGKENWYIRTTWCRPMLVSDEFLRGATTKNIVVIRPSINYERFRSLPIKLTWRPSSERAQSRDNYSLYLVGLYPPQPLGSSVKLFRKVSTGKKSQPARQSSWRAFLQWWGSEPPSSITSGDQVSGSTRSNGKGYGNTKGDLMVIADLIGGGTNSRYLIVLEYDVEVVGVAPWRGRTKDVRCRVFRMARHFLLETLHNIAATGNFSGFLEVKPGKSENWTGEDMHIYDVGVDSHRWLVVRVHDTIMNSHASRDRTLWNTYVEIKYQGTLIPVGS